MIAKVKYLVTSADEIENTVSESQSRHLTSRSSYPDFLLRVFELYNVLSIVDSTSRVDRYLHAGLDVAVYLVSPSLH